jgi:putative ABC transport system ATP-binding protein
MVYYSRRILFQEKLIRLEMMKVLNVYKSYVQGNRDVEVLKGINFEIKDGESLSIIGPSGSGKTTLLSIMAGLDSPSKGHVELNNTDISKLSEVLACELRNKKIGFIFQSFELISDMTAFENVALPLELSGHKKYEEKAYEMLDKVGLSHRTNHYPNELSGGEKQRVAIARAFINNPDIVFADEPTGNVDDSTGAGIIKLLFDFVKSSNKKLVLVTHNLELAKLTDRKLKIEGGKVIEL